MNRALILLCVVALGVFAACESETGPDAPQRQNGCIDTDCASSSGSGSSSSGGGDDAGGDAQ